MIHPAHSRLLLVATLALASSLGAAQWPQFRGPNAGGLDETQALPTTWNVETGQNIRWQTPVPGLAHANAIVWDDRVYIATAVKASQADLKVGLYGDIESVEENEPHEWRLLALDRATGKVLWNVLGLKAVPKVKRHPKATHCNSTPATDGQRLVGCLDNGAVTCFEAGTGKIIYSAKLSADNQGFTASPVSDGRHLYFPSEPGTVFVVKVAGQFSLVASNALNETCMSTPAIADGALFFRTRTKVIAVGTPKR